MEGAELKVAQWYCPFKLGESWTGALHPLVALQGVSIQTEQVDRAVWELLNLKASKDFTPNYTLNPTLPPKKQKREGVELQTYIPDGLLAADWAKKHRTLVPAVLVAFFKEDSPEAKENIPKALAQLRADWSQHGTQLLVMLIKSPGDEELSTERASALCAAADIPPKSVFILAHSHPDRIHTCVHRLENGMREAAKSYYAARLRRVKNKKEHMTQPQMQIRFNFKLGFFHEVRRDYVSAMGHYEASLDALVRFGSSRCSQEVMVLASVLSHRMCRLHLLRRDWNEAKVQFNKVVKAFIKMGASPGGSGANELMFEHIAWLEQQYHSFGELTKQYYRPDSLNMADPVNYFIKAAKYAQQRAHYSKQTLLASGPLAIDQSLVGAVDLKWTGKYLGQRPYPPTDAAKWTHVLKFFETLSPHSENVINHLGIASEFCREIGRLRTRCQLMTGMGEEFFRSGEYKRCTLLMGHVLREFGSEKWAQLLYHVASVGLKASVVLPEIPAYINFLVILLKRDLAPMLGEERRSLLALNLESVIDSKVPQNEIPSDLNTEEWEKGLGSEVKSYVGVHGESIVETWVSFQEDSVSVHKATPITFRLKNCHSHPLNIKSVGVQTNITEYDGTQEVNLKLDPGQTHQTQLNLTPLPRDANKVIQLQVGIVDIGKADISVLLHYSLIHTSSCTLWKDWEEERRGQNVIKVEGSRPLLKCEVKREDPALVGEAHKLTFLWSNTDSEPVSRLLLTFFLSAANPQHVRLSTDPLALLEESGTGGGTGGSLSHSVEVNSLAPGDQKETTLYLKVSTESELKIISKAKYIDSLGQPLGTDCVTLVQVVSPFQTSSSMHNIQSVRDPVQSVSPLQPFLFHHQITNSSSTSIQLHEVHFNPTNTYAARLGGTSNKHISDGIVLQPNESVRGIQMLQLTTVPPQEAHENMASLHVIWSRSEDGGEAGLAVTSHYGIGLPPVDTSAVLYLSGECGHGRLKRPMLINFLLVNRSQKCYDVTFSIDSTEFFMNAGPKKINVKLGGKDHVQLDYILFPLKTGLLPGPKVVVEGVDSNSQPLVVHRDVPKSIFVTRGEAEE